MIFRKKRLKEVSFTMTSVFATNWTFAANVNTQKDTIEIHFDESNGCVSMKNLGNFDETEVTFVAQALRSALTRLIDAYKADENYPTVTLVAQ